MTKKWLSTIGSCVIVLVISPFVHAETTSLNDAKLQAIQSRCQTSQTLLKNTQESDKLARINRGHIYETTLQLFVNFNARVVANKVDAPNLLTITSDFQTERKAFTELYTKYDDHMTNLVTMDCKAQPTEFYDQLVSARDLRSQLHESTSAIDALLQKYYDVVSALHSQLDAGDEAA